MIRLGDEGEDSCFMFLVPGSYLPPGTIVLSVPGGRREPTARNIRSMCLLLHDGGWSMGGQG